MTDLVVDASVVAKWFLPERDNHQAILIRDAARRGSLHLLAPDLLICEFGNVLWKKRDQLASDESLEMINELLAVRNLLLIPSVRLIASAYQLACLYNRTIYDSMYLATAQLYRCDLVTADERLYNAVHESLSFVKLLRHWA